MSPGRVLHLTLSYGQGGRSRAICALLEGLAGLGVECDLCCLDELSGPAEEIGGLVGVIDALRRRSLVDWKALGRLHALCRERGVRVIHAHDAASQFTAALLRLRDPGLRLLMTFHRSLGFESARFRDRVRNAFAGALSGAVVTGSRERREHFLRENWVSPAKVVRIPFGIDTARFRPDPEARAAVRREFGLRPDTVVLGAIGHFHELKGLDVAVKGFAALIRRRPASPVALVILGDGPPARRDLLHALARECQPARVVFAGFRPDVERCLAAFDLFVHAPRQEAFGLVLIEALAAGLPVVATRVGGIPDIIRDGSTGILVPPEAPEELADAIGRLLDDAALRRALGERSCRQAESEFRLELYARRYLGMYEDLLNDRPPRTIDESEGEKAVGNGPASPPDLTPLPGAARRALPGPEKGRDACRNK
jgi:glycosyltransferase involved in cell wall biosynthesis